MVTLKKSDLVLIVLLSLAAWNPTIPWLDGRTISGPVSRVIVLYVSEAPPQEAVKVANITGGVTAQSLRKAGKWRAWDTQSVPDGSKPLLDSAESFPWLAILHGSKVTHQGKLPGTEAEFAALVAKQGGVQ